MAGGSDAFSHSLTHDSEGGAKTSRGSKRNSTLSQRPETQAIWKVEATRKQLAAKDAEVAAAQKKLQAAEVI
jgi:hypothetical protein